VKFRTVFWESNVKHGTTLGVIAISSMSHLAAFSSLWAGELSEVHRPNIIWIISEDMGPDLGCWGASVHTPNIDRLAADGMRFTRVFGTASVCMPNRTAMITGVTQTTLGSVTMRPPKQFMRPLPGKVKPLPTLMREHGYYTGNIRDNEIGSTGKDDWNFQFEGKRWDTTRLSDLKARQPFYAQFNFAMAHRPFRQDATRPIDPRDVDLPPYYPDHPVTRQAWSDYLESIQHLDRNVGRVTTWLRREGLTENTIVFFLSDHGEAFLRGKYFLYDCSLNQPLIIRWPRACKPPAEFNRGAASDRLLAAIDVTAQTVECAGGTVPRWMHGQPFLGPNAKQRSEVFSAADWYGGSKLKSRSIRTERYKYIRNFNTSLSVHGASTEYRKAMHPMYHLLELLHERGELVQMHRRLLLDPLPDEELYDLVEDPHELNNLAAESTLAEQKQKLRHRLEEWIEESGDLGFEPKHPDHVQFFDDYRENSRRRYASQREKVREVVRKVVEGANMP
jgi:uncharacterized sulfatase